MSRFSSKCDLYDHFWMGNDTEDDVNAEIARTDFYMWNNGRRHKLAINNLKDLAPYYPFLIGVACGSKTGRNTVCIASESFVDEEEREFMGWELRDALREYNRCKRKKIPFDPDAYYEKYIKSWHREHNYTREIINRVAKFGKKANLDGLHSAVKDKWERTDLARELSRFGYDDYFINMWVFGYRKEYPNWKENEE